MGGRSSRPAGISYEEAAQRLSIAELERLNACFQKYQINDHINLETFVSNVLSNETPKFLSKMLFEAFGSTPRGLCQKRLIVGLVTLAKGDLEERARFLFDIFSSNGDYISRNDMFILLRAFDDNQMMQTINKLFVDTSSDKVDFESFFKWALLNQKSLSITEWLLLDQPLVLSANSKCHNFYQTLSGITHLDENDIVSVEKQYSKLVDYRVGKLNLDHFRTILNSIMCDYLLEGFFHAFDENQDGQIDFKEMVCGISACCRGPRAERLKFVFKMLDRSRSGFVVKSDLCHFCEVILSEFVDFTPIERDKANDDKSTHGLLNLIARQKPADDNISLEQFCVLAVQLNAFDELLCLLYQTCHILFGLPPASKKDEKSIILSWTNRVRRRGYQADQIWYLIAKHWWRQWENWMDFEDTIPVQRPSKQPCDFVRFNRSNSRTDSLISTSDSQDSGSSNGIKTVDVYSPVEPGISEDKALLLVENGAKSPDILALNESGFESESSSCATIICDEKSPSRPESSVNFRLNFPPAVETTKFRRSPSSSLRNWAPCPRNIPENELIVEYRMPTKPGPIDNSPLICGPCDRPSTSKLISLTLEGGILKPGYSCDDEQNDDFVVVSDLVWRAITRWYRGGSPTLPRNVLFNASTGKYELELYPTVVTILKHQQFNAGYCHNSQFGSAFLFGAPTHYSSYSHYSGGATNHSSISRVPSYLAAFSKNTPLGELFKFIRQRLNLNAESTRFWLVNSFNDDYNSSTVTLLEDESVNIDTLKLSAKLNILVECRNADLTWPEELLGLTRNKQQIRLQTCERGLAGLANLGNTCFMNSALQCISNTQPLTQYFTRNVHLYELNKDNKLGIKGQMALQYGNLVKDLWSGNTKITAPLKLRYTVCKYAPTFNDFNQHDCQELLAFLLDGLHEDLNRIEQKIYKELKDSNGRPDEVVAAEAWENHLRRNQSIVVDLFHGLLMSAVTCNVCKSVSVKFDPFTFLSLPLPLDNNVFIQIVVITLDGSRPKKYGVRLASHRTLFDVKEHLSKLCGIDSDRLLIVQLYNHSYIQEFLSNSTRLKNFSNSTLYCFEVPAQNQPSKLNLSSDLNTKPEMDAEGNEGQGKTVHRSVSSAQCRPSVPLYNRSLSTVVLESNQFKHCANNNQAKSRIFFPLDARGFTIGVQRRMERTDLFFVAHHQYKPIIFGQPIVLASDVDHVTWSGQSLYDNVRAQLSRFMSTVPRPKSQINHALDGDEDLYREYPFKLKTVARSNGFVHCSRCRWFKFCFGCEIECDDRALVDLSDCFVAIDWDITAWHLRYRPCVELEFDEDDSVRQALLAHTEPITLDSCLKAFTQPEELGDGDNYYCSKCKAHCPASKKLDLWRLPPILIVHFKRFQYINDRWAKSCKLVDFPLTNFDPSQYLTPVPSPSPSTRENSDVSPQPAIACQSIATSSHCNDLTTRDRGRQDGQGAASAGQSLVTPDCRDGVQSSQSPLVLPCGQHNHRLKDDALQADLKYDLYAIAGHAGMLGSGHYVAYAKNINGKWYLYNDSSCKQIDPKNIDSNLAYILFYERRGLDYGKYIPDFTGKAPEADTVDQNIEDQLMGRACSLQ